MELTSNNTFAGKETKLSLLLSQLYRFYYKERKGQYLVYALTFFIALLYAVINNVIFGRPDQSVAIESIVFAAILLVSIPIAYNLGAIQVKSEKTESVPKGVNDFESTPIFEPSYPFISSQLLQLTNNIQQVQGRLDLVLHELAVLNQRVEESEARKDLSILPLTNPIMVPINPGSGLITHNISRGMSHHRVAEDQLLKIIRDLAPPTSQRMALFFTPHSSSGDIVALSVKDQVIKRLAKWDLQGEKIRLKNRYFTEKSGFQDLSHDIGHESPFWEPGSKSQGTKLTKKHEREHRKK